MNVSVSPYFLDAATKAVEDSKSQDWGCLLDEEKLHDVLFEVGSNNERETVGAVSTLLALNSSVFRSMLFGDEQKCGEGVQTGSTRFSIPDVDPKAFKLLLRFLYAGKLEISEQTAVSLLHAALKFDVPLLEYECLIHLKGTVYLSNVCRLLVEADAIGHKALAEYLRSYIEVNGEKFFNLEDIEFISYEQLLSLVAANEHLGGKSEKIIFDCCMKWTEYKCDEKLMEKTMKNRLVVLSDIINAIDFCRMEHMELGTDIRDLNILSDDQMLEIFIKKSQNNYKPRKKVNHKLKSFSPKKPAPLRPLADISVSPDICDVTFSVGKEKQDISSCRAVMATRCEYFAAMFYNDILAESQPGAQPIVPNYSPTAFKALLQLFYDQDIDQKLEQDDIVHLIEMTGYYTLNDVFRSKIILKVAPQITLAVEPGNNNVCSLLTLGIQMKTDWLTLYCGNFILDRSREVYKSNSYNLSYEALKYLIVDEGFLQLKEIEIFEMCVEWSRQRCKQDKSEPNPRNCRKFLRDLLGHIRFPVMDSTEVASIVYDSNVLTQDEMLRLTLYFCSNCKRDVAYSKEKRNPFPKYYTPGATIPPEATPHGKRWTLEMSSMHSGPGVENTYEVLVDVSKTNTGAGTNSSSGQYIMAIFDQHHFISSVTVSGPKMSCGFVCCHINGATIQCFIDGKWLDVATISGVENSKMKAFHFHPLQTNKVRLYKSSGQVATGHFIIA